MWVLEGEREILWRFRGLMGFWVLEVVKFIFSGIVLVYISDDVKFFGFDWGLT